MRRMATVALAGAAVMLVAGTARAAASPAQISRLIAAMTLDEKLGMVQGWPGAGSPPPSGGRNANVGYIPGVARLGIPSLTFTDGPAGVRMVNPPPERETTAMPAPVALAATFGTGQARSYGDVLGGDARARDQDVIFAPMANLVRVPQAGRNFETLGEDPLLMSRLIASETRGIQSKGTIATVKHFAENNQEDERQTIDVKVDERTFHEMEAPGFEAGVKAGAGSVMCSYNSVNGHFACENPTLETDVLRGQWGFKGFVVSDYGANHSAGPSLEAGTDIEFLGTHFAGLKAAMTGGSVPVSALDSAVGHILTTMDRFGLLKNASASGGTPVVRPVPSLDVTADARVARRLAEQGAVLLRNRGGALPLTRRDLRRLAVIGPSARQLLVGGAGSSRVVGFTQREKSPLAVLRARGAHARFAVGRDLLGVTVPSTALAPPGAPSGRHGLLRTDHATGATRVDPTVDFVGADALPHDTNATWTGTITAPSAGLYRIGVQTAGTTATVTVDGNQVASGGGFSDLLGHSLERTLDNRLAVASGLVTLSAGAHTVSVAVAPPRPFPPFLEPSSAPAELRLTWVTAQQRTANLAAAVAAARAARTAVVFAYDLGSEGTDRSTLALPDEQDALIRAVARANKRTVVVLNTGDPVLMPWRSAVRSILEMWYPGQEGGAATADVLLGRADPGGRLPETFPRRAKDAPTNTPERYPGVGGEETYSEGIFVGYRWYDKQHVRPLYEFGRGLSYTRFAYSRLRVARLAGGALRVRFDVRNAGTRRGTAVPQVYVGAPPRPPAPLAVRSLAAFGRVALAPGRRVRVTLRVGPRQLSYWSTARHRWVVVTGFRRVYVGESSRDLRLSRAVRVR